MGTHYKKKRIDKKEKVEPRLLQRKKENKELMKKKEEMRNFNYCKKKQKRADRTDKTRSGTQILNK